MTQYRREKYRLRSLTKISRNVTHIRTQVHITLHTQSNYKRRSSKTYISKYVGKYTLIDRH